MALVTVSPGDMINFTYTGQSPFNTGEVTLVHSISYEDLRNKLLVKSKHKSRKSGTKGAKFSRVVALSFNAIKKGKWSTGKDIDRDKVFSNLMKTIDELPSSEFQNITKKAKGYLRDLYHNKEGNLSHLQATAVKLFIRDIEGVI